MAKNPTLETKTSPESGRTPTRDPEPYFVLKIGGFSMTAKQLPARLLAMIAGVAVTAISTTPIWNR
ncbi:hypothetical protein [Streptomyces sp. NPDC055506]